ncbi:YCII-related domain-containing protein [Bryocella elongata]|uniref:YCII-related domain-containing protein n=2 Tax=Bryocella elongata TaxID=863522 RepID=A0A1H6A500_9BACT|nr:YCII-related domain-containing protein [Bryocella elongata]
MVAAVAQDARAQSPAASTPAPATASATVQFFGRLIAPRATFAQDMTPAEMALMQQHAAYWADQFKTGKVLLLGRVMDPKGAYGIWILQTASEAEARAMIEGDPTIKAGLNHYELTPMHVFLHR